MPLVKNTPTDAGGNIRPNARVAIKHVPDSGSFYDATLSEPVYTLALKTDSTGMWSASLPVNNANTYYEIVEASASRIYIQVPDPNVTPVPDRGWWWVKELLAFGPGGGEQGGGGSEVSVGAVFVYNQLTPSATWTIAHNLGYNPAVVVTDSTGSIVYGNVSYPDVNTVVLTFSAPFSGRADLI